VSPLGVRAASCTRLRRKPSPPSPRGESSPPARYRADRLAQRLDAVEHEQDALLGILAPLDQVRQQRGRDRPVLRTRHALGEHMSRRLDDVRLAVMMIDGERLGRALGSSEREMESELALTPLQPREFFGTPWSGEGEWTPRPWLCWLPGPRRFRFRSFTSWLTDELWLVHDTTIWEDGREERRDGLARLVAADRIRFTYDDMPGGTEIQLYTDGFAFAPYRMLVVIPFLPIPLQILAHDSCSWDAASHELRDTINVSLIGLPPGRQVTRLRPEPGHSTSRTNF
jgi:hypothetical protein